jgi:hypothetical protein
MAVEARVEVTRAGLYQMVRAAELSESSRAEAVPVAVAQQLLAQVSGDDDFSAGLLLLSCAVDGARAGSPQQGASGDL